MTAAKSAADAIWRVFDHVYVINLPERADRRRQIGAELARIGLSFDDPRVTLFRATRPTDPGHFPDIGSRGCFESQTGVLRAMIAGGHSRILMLEDDTSFCPDIATRLAELADLVQDREWHILYGFGPGAKDERRAVSRKAALQVDVLPHDHGLRLSHFMGFSRDIAERLVPFLDGLHDREMFHPEGGAMHVDGAYSTYRAAHPDVVTLVTVPRLAWQRPSRSDIHAAKWFENIAVMRPVLAVYRSAKSRLR